jgi:ElaB/YqjD/DUF883 family membrane-anchored ribosome-binding protein
MGSRQGRRLGIADERTAMDTTASAADASHDLASKLRRLIGEAEDLLRSAADTGDEAFNAARERVSEQVRHMRDELEDLEDKAARNARRAARAADRAVHEHPYGAMGLAAAVGLLIGVLVARR